MFVTFLVLRLYYPTQNETSSYWYTAACIVINALCTSRFNAIQGWSIVNIEVSHVKIFK